MKLSAGEIDAIHGGTIWLLVKRDLYWRPNSQGYTGIRDEAGRYTFTEASQRANGGDGTTMIRADLALEFRKSTYPDLVAAHLLKQRALKISETHSGPSDLRAKIDRARATPPALTP